MKFSSGVGTTTSVRSKGGEDVSNRRDADGIGWDRRCDKCHADLPVGAFHLSIVYDASHKPPMDIGGGESRSSAMFRLCTPCVRAVASWVSTS